MSLNCCRAHRILLHIPPSRNISSTRNYAYILGNLPGLNLSNFHRRFETPPPTPVVEQKDESKKDVDEIKAASVAPSPSSSVGPASPEIFHGFRIPKEPQPPADDECCMSNCAVCVYDLYDDSMEAYRESVAELRSSLSALKIPETQWPLSIRPPKKPQPTVSRKDVVQNAFEEMERMLREKRQKKQPPAAAAAATATSSH